MLTMRRSVPGVQKTTAPVELNSLSSHRRHVIEHGHHERTLQIASSRQ